MPLIKKINEIQLNTLKIKIPNQLEEEIQKYCGFADVDTDQFFTQCAEIILKKDKEWQAYKEQH